MNIPLEELLSICNSSSIFYYYDHIDHSKDLLSNVCNLSHASLYIEQYRQDMLLSPSTKSFVTFYRSLNEIDNMTIGEHSQKL